jgi:hypothetical protein
MKTITALTAARDLLQDINKWTQKAGARTDFGATIHPAHDNASCFCSGGALERIVISRSGEVGGAFHRSGWRLDQAARLLGYRGYIHLNDDTSKPREEQHALVIRMFDMAITTEAAHS